MKGPPFMSHRIEDVNSCTKKIICTFEGDFISNEIGIELQKKSKEAQLKGFRKGKAPLSLVAKIYGQEAESKALERFISEKCFDVFEAEKIRPLHAPMIADLDYKPKEKIHFEAVVEIVPTVVIAEDYLSSKKFDAYKAVEVSKEELENAVKGKLSKHAIYKEADSNHVIANNDKVLVKFHVSVPEDESIASFEDEAEVVAGSEQSDFNLGQEILSLKLNDKKTFSFKENESAKERSVEAQILEVKVQEIPELTAEELTAEFQVSSMEELNNKTKEELEVAAKNRFKEEHLKKIFEMMREEIACDVPKSLVEQEYQNSVEQFVQMAKRFGINPDLKENKYLEGMKAEAATNVHNEILLNQLIEDWKVEVSEDDVKDLMNLVALQSGKSKEEVESFFNSNNEKKFELEYRKKREKVLDLMVEKTNVL